MKNIVNKRVGYKIKLQKGYKTKLKRLIEKSGFGGIETIARDTGINRDTISRIAREGDAARSVKERIELYIDEKVPTRKTA